jgi:hypothetical protein
MRGSATTQVPNFIFFPGVDEAEPVYHKVFYKSVSIEEKNIYLLFYENKGKYK